MCGVAGIISLTSRPIDSLRLKAMTDTLSRRGPDDAGHEVRGSVGFGHRRLSIIDTSLAGRQPMTSTERQQMLICNGEIYNYQELKNELQKAGYQFQSQSDSEVLLHGWEEYGVDLVQKLNGMFAFAIFDEAKQEIFIARDRLGQKPLYYRVSDQEILFSSELKAIMQVSENSLSIDRQSVAQYTNYGYSLFDQSMFESVKKLPPAHYLHIDLKNITSQSMQPTRYWHLPTSEDPTLSTNNFTEQLETKLTNSIRSRLMSDVPLGAFLSGGVDSSLICGIIKKTLGVDLETFSIGFHQKELDETAYALEVAEYLNLKNTTKQLGMNIVKIIPDLLNAYDEPFADASAIPTFYLCKLARQSVTVALSGDGGDELFLGYNRYQEARDIHQLNKLIPNKLRSIARAIPNALPFGFAGKRQLSKVLRQNFDLYNFLLGWRADHLAVLTPDLRQQISANSYQSLERSYDEASSFPFCQRLANTDILSYLPEDILVKVDRASMYHGLEVRSPFLDHELVELATRCPRPLKLDHHNSKIALKRVAEKYLPKNILSRPKMGFGVPLTSWLRNELRDEMTAMLQDHSHGLWHTYDQAMVQKVWRLHTSGNQDHSALLWRILYFYLWMNRYKVSA